MRQLRENSHRLSRYSLATSLLLVMALMSLSGVPAYADSEGQAESGANRGSDSITGPDAVANQLRQDRADKDSFFEVQALNDWRSWKQAFAEDTGFNFTVDYIYFGYEASDSIGEDSAASGVLRLYGKWDILGRGSDDTGSLIFKVENRDAYDGVAPQDFGGELGYVGLIHCCASDQGARTTNLYWRQSWDSQRIVNYTGFIDISDYTDVYALASPWTGFSNLVFSTGSGTIGGLPDGALGTMVATWLSDSVYVVAGMADANADPTDVFDGFNTFFDDFETFKNIDIHYTPRSEELFFNNMHVSFYQIDKRDEAGTNDGYGVSFSLTRAVQGKFLPFIRGGWGKDGNSLLEASASIGFGYQDQAIGAQSLLGVGLNWGRPNDDTFGADLDDQYTAEIFYRWQVFESLQITPSVQLISDPALNPDDDFISVWGVRARLIL
jgi:porin